MSPFDFVSIDVTPSESSIILIVIYKLDASTNGNYAMANLCNDVMYDGWGKPLAAGHRECMGTSKHVEKIHLFLLDRSPPCATQRVGVFIS